jgi:hypothetical protein
MEKFCWWVKFSSFLWVNRTPAITHPGGAVALVGMSKFDIKEPQLHSVVTTLWLVAHCNAKDSWNVRFSSFLWLNDIARIAVPAGHS